MTDCKLVVSELRICISDYQLLSNALTKQANYKRMHGFEVQKRYTYLIF